MKIHIPCNVLITHIQKDEEALVVGGVCFVSLVHLTYFHHVNEIDDMNVDLLGDGRRVEHILDAVVFGPWATVDIQVSMMEREGILLAIVIK